MAEQPPHAGEVFDIRKIRRLVELMQEHDLSEIELCQADTRLRLRRQRDGGAAAYAPPSAAPPVASPPPAPVAAGGSQPAAEEQHHVVTSPMVGTFYTSPSPEAPPFVKVGDHVGPDTTVCIVEAMKVFNEIPAGASGKIVAVLVENGEPVEYGQPLFKIDSRT